MFRRPTVLVVGAGASFEAGFPIGSDLLRKLSASLNLNYEFTRYFWGRITLGRLKGVIEGGNMKSLVCVTLAMLAVPAFAQSEPPAVQRASVTPGAGAIVMYRGSGVMGAALACPIRYKGREIVELGRGKYAEWAVPAGRYILVNGTASVEVSVDPGETRYVRCQIKTGFLTGRADLQIVDEETFTAHKAEYEQKAVSSPF